MTAERPSPPDGARPPDPFARRHRNWPQRFGAGWEAVRTATAARAEGAIDAWALADVEPFAADLPDPRMLEPACR